MSTRFFKHSLQRVSTFLNIEKSADVPNPVLLHSSCFIVPTSIHINIPIQYHYIMPAHMVNPFFFQHFIAQNDAQLRYFDKLRHNPSIDLKKDLKAMVHILSEEWIDPVTGMAAPVGRKLLWDNHIEEMRKEYASTLEGDTERIGSAISKNLAFQDSVLPVYSFELDLQNAFFHTELNLAVVHAKEDPSPLIFSPDRAIQQWCDRELHPDDVVYYTGWQIEDLGTFTPEYIAPYTWKGRLKHASGTRLVSEPFPQSSEGKFHEGMTGGAIFSDRGCIGMIEGVIAPKQSMDEKLLYQKPKIQGVAHITHEMLEKFILEVVEPQMEDRYGKEIGGSYDSESAHLFEMERDWRNEL